MLSVTHPVHSVDTPRDIDCGRSGLESFGFEGIKELEAESTFLGSSAKGFTSAR